VAPEDQEDPVAPEDTVAPEDPDPIVSLQNFRMTGSRMGAGDSIMTAVVFVEDFREACLIGGGVGVAFDAGAVGERALHRVVEGRIEKLYFCCRLHSNLEMIMVYIHSNSEQVRITLHVPILFSFRE
jgi:hypothetical protein